MYDDETCVLIAGGGLAGLSAALFLSRHGVPCVLVERHPGISNHPRGSAGNPRSMELFRWAGLETPLLEAGAGLEANRSFGKVESLTGAEYYRFELPSEEDLRNVSPTRFGMAGQDRVEPILRARAEELGADVRFNTELVSFEQDPKGVTATLRDRATGTERTIRAQYMVAADGGRSAIRERLGIRRHGQGTLVHQMSILFRANLEGPLNGRRFLVCQVENQRVQAVLGHDETLRRGTLIVTYFPERGERPEDFTHERCIEMVRAAVGLPDLDVGIESAQPWELAAWVADRFHDGRVLLAGDAAHVIPPIGGFGGNTGVQDTHNLAWKLALVLAGTAGSALLDTYDAERRPIADFTVEQAMLRLHHRGQGDAPPEMLSDLAVILGYWYRSTAILPEDGDQPCAIEPRELLGEPGTRAPHIILERQGERLSTLDLFGGCFVLLVGEDGGRWCDAARRTANRLGIQLVAHCIGGVEIADIEGRWAAAYGISATGASLVRPDGFVGWRIREGMEDPDRVLEEAMSRLLHRSPAPMPGDQTA